MIYTSTMTLIVPLDQLETAKRVSRSLDPDSGGYEAFAARVQKDGKEYAIYSTPVTASFASNAAMLLALPDELHAVVSADYATRWPDLVCPSLEELTALCSAIECYIDSKPEDYIYIQPESYTLN